MTETPIVMLVLAGGFGTRLRSAVDSTPKSMAPINGTPLLNLQIDHWIKQGQRDFVFLLHYQAEIIVKFLIAKSEMLGGSVNISWIVEETPLGTGGAVSHAIHQKNLTGDVLISNADTWLDSGLKQLSSSPGAAIAVIETKDISRYGSIILDNDLFLTKFIEKTKFSGSDKSGMINAGLYKLPTKIFPQSKKKKFAIETEVLPRMASKKLLKGEILHGTFFDIGVPEDYYKFCEWYKTYEKNS